MMYSLLRIRNLTFGFVKGKPPIFDSMNFSLEAGQRVSILGANGAGKSTLINLCLGMLEPISGRVELFGQRVRQRSHFPALGFIGALGHRESYASLPNDLRLENLLRVFHAAIGGSTSDYCSSLYNELGLGKLVSARAHIGTLSKGERQRLISYLALAKKPKLLLADEPFEGLDADSAVVIRQALQHCLAQSETAMLLISHRVCECLEFANVHYRLSDGKLQNVDRDRFLIKLTVNSLPMSFSEEYPELVFERLANLASHGSLNQATLALERNHG